MKIHSALLVLASTSLAMAQADFGMTSEAHRKHVGKVVFSKSPIVFKAEKEAQFGSHFQFPAEKPYFMAYFPKSIANACQEEHGVRPDLARATVLFNFFLTGEKVAGAELEINAPQLNQWTGWSDPAVPLGKTDGMLPSYALLFREKVLPKLQKGTNNIRMELHYRVQSKGKILQSQKPLASGEFILNLSEIPKAALQEAPKALWRDAALEKQIKESLTKRWGTSLEILRIILTEKDWRIEKHPVSGQPERKVLAVYAITRIKEGSAQGQCMARPYEVKREYLGSGKFSETILWHSSAGRPSFDVRCE